MTPSEFKALRVSTGYSQAEVGARWGVSERTVRRLETDPAALAAMPVYADALRHVATEPKPEADRAHNLR